MRLALAILAVMATLFVASSATVYWGSHDVAASKASSPILAWLLHTAMVNSVERHARHIEPPPVDPGLRQLGFEHYREHCVGCHGAPGLPPSDLARGLNPSAPDLARPVDSWSPAQLFWIVKNGVEMTGMPAWGATHSDEELWQIVAFLRELPTLSPEQYQALDRERGSYPSHAHVHAEPGEQ